MILAQERMPLPDEASRRARTAIVAPDWLPGRFAPVLYGPSRRLYKSLLIAVADGGHPVRSVSPGVGASGDGMAVSGVLCVVSTGRPAPRRVFLSRAAELRAYPARRSFVGGVACGCGGVIGRSAGDAVIDMAYFTAREDQPGEVCRRAVGDAVVFVLIAGFRYGSPARDRPEVSYTELEHAGMSSAITASDQLSVPGYSAGAGGFG
jgi:hypothetical protein